MFNSEQFNNSWGDWKSHYEGKTGVKYSEVAERKAKSALFIKSHGIESLAIESIEWSIEKNWSAIYIKPSDNANKSKTNIMPQSNRGQLSSTAIIKSDRTFNPIL